jgi:crotonobetainyl-CoA:carnitine CoA-transferase CaiB-like acyl-CoA transferase
MGPLAGIRVLDLSRVLAGPWATQTLADLGAEVFKIERPGSGDETRHWGPPFLGDATAAAPDSAYFLCANRGKRSVAVNFEHLEGQRLLRDLATRCDVLIENFRAGGLAKYGLDYATLAALHPGLVYCSITGFGQTGPLARHPGYDFLVQGMGGLMSITGSPDGEPMKVGVAVTDVMTGLYASTAILAALLHRQRTGAGQWIDLALLDVQVAALANQASACLVSGQEPERLGNAHPSIVPYEAYPTADGHIIIAVGNDEQFARFAQAAGEPGLAADPRYAANPQRVRHRAALATIIRRLLAARGTAAWRAIFAAAGVPCGPVNGVSAALAEPQVAARGMVNTVRHPRGEYRAVGSPIRLSATPVRSDVPPPLLGADTDGVLHELLGLDAEALAALRGAGAIG